MRARLHAVYHAVVIPARSRGCDAMPQLRRQLPRVRLPRCRAYLRVARRIVERHVKCPQRRQERDPDRSPFIARSAISSRRPNRAAARNPPRNALASSCRCITRRGCITIFAWKPAACLLPGRFPKVRRWSRAIGGSPCTWKIIRWIIATSKGRFPPGNTAPAASSYGIAGTYTLAEGDDPAAEIANGKIKFVMHGKKLKGEFTLVKIKAREDEHGDPWLLIKDRDEHADPKYDPAKHPESVKSGKTLADIAADPRSKTWQSKPASRVRQRRDARRKSSAIRCRVSNSPMLATLVEKPFDDPNWLFEIKWDGYRAICTVEEKSLDAYLAQRARYAAAFSRSIGTGRRVRKHADRRGWRDRQSRCGRPFGVSTSARIAETAGRPHLRRVRSALRRRRDLRKSRWKRARRCSSG